MPKHCATCSRSEPEAKFYGEFCEFCTHDKIVASLPTELRLRICKRCERIWTGFRYSPPTRKAVEDAIALQLKGYKIKVLEYDGKSAKTELTKQVSGDPFMMEITLMIDPERLICEDCYKRSSGYWEGCLQLRGNEDKVRKTEEKIIRYIDHTSAFIAKTEEADNGIDIYISDKRVASQLCMFLKLKPQTSFTLYGLKAGRRVSRNTYAIHL